MVEWISKLFGNEEDKRLYERNKELIDDNERLERSLEILREANRNIAEQCVELENKLELLKTDPDQYIETEVERRMMAYEKAHECDMNHRWYGIGRQDAYREMGIWNIEAHKRDNVLVMDKQGNIFELLPELEDVKASADEQTTSDEIEINDLLELKA